MTKPASPALTPALAFVVQLQSPLAPTPEALAGRVEHISSGRVGRFQSLKELYEFMGQAPTPALDRIHRER